MKVLLTGAAGFIGFHTARWLLARGHEVVGLDSIDPYYDVGIKYGRLAELGVEKGAIAERREAASSTQPAFRFVLGDLTDRPLLEELFAAHGFERVCNLAAQAGVRYSLQDPHKYIQSNIVGFMNVLEACRHNKVGHLAYASSSSVYGLNSRVPFSTGRGADHPMSIYAATKRSNELMAHTYSHLYGLPTTGLRFFTVYGPWGRPDMALFLFTRSILAGEPIEVFNNGRMIRDFTYVDDIVEGVGRVVEAVPGPAAAWDADNPRPDISSAPYRVYNIGNDRPVELMDFIRCIEKELGRKADIRYLPMQPGDVPATRADVSDLERDFGFRPRTSVEEGIREFVRWYRAYYRV